MCTYTAQSFTTVAGQVGITLPAGALLITSFNILGKPIWGLIFLAFISQNPVLIGLTVVVYLVLYIGWYRNKNKVRDYLDRQAEKNSLEVESKWGVNNNGKDECSSFT